MAADLQPAARPLSSVLAAKCAFEKSSQAKDSSLRNGGPPTQASRLGATVALATRTASAKDSFVLSVKEKYEQKTAKRSPAAATIPTYGALQRATSLDSTTLPASAGGRSCQRAFVAVAAAAASSSCAVSTAVAPSSSSAAGASAADDVASDINDGVARSRPSGKTSRHRCLRADDSGVEETPGSSGEASPCDAPLSDGDVERFRSIIEHLRSCTAAEPSAGYDTGGGGGGGGRDSAVPSSQPSCPDPNGADAAGCGEADGPYKRLMTALGCCKTHSPLLQLVAKTLVDTLMALASYRKKCAALEQAYRKCDQELQCAQLEMAEMRDKFNEDDGGGASDVAEMQRENGALSRANRTLQFKLKSAEKRAQELELAKSRLDEELRRLRPGGGPRSPPSCAVAEALENELLALREVVASARQEASSSAEMRRFYEQEIDKLKRERGDLQLENERLRSTAAAAAAAAPAASSRDGHAQTLQNGDRVGGGGSGVEDALRSDLETSIERERDAKEQLQFAQAEIASLRRKLKEVEGDNESLAYQIKRLSSGGKPPQQQQPLTNGHSHHAPAGLAAPVAAAAVDDDDTPPAAAMTPPARRRRALAAATTTASAAAAVVSSRQPPSTAGGGGALALDVGSVYREAKYEAMSLELEELRWQLAERDRIIAQAKERAAGKQAPPPLRKAVSLDSSALSSVDSSRQIDLMHQEAQVLRDKLLALEADHERAVKENKKLLMLLSRKASGSVDKKAPADAKEEIAALRAECVAVRQKLEMVLSGTQSGRLIDELESENSQLKTELAFYQRSRRLAKEEDY